MTDDLIIIFCVSTLLNLVWENKHCQLYKTCIEMPKEKKSPLLFWTSIKDGFWITAFYIFSFSFWKIMLFQIIFFTILCLAFAIIVEKISTATKRWEYDKKMPLIFNIGLTPLIQLPTIGIISIIIAYFI